MRMCSAERGINEEKRRSLVRSGILAAGLAVLSAGFTLNAHANEITLDVSATFTPVALRASCEARGCTLGGDIVVNESTGAIISEDVTAAGFSPEVGLFTRNFGVVAALGQTIIVIRDSAGYTLFLDLSSPTAGSLAGYTGGSLELGTAIERGNRNHLDGRGRTTHAKPSRSAVWELESGSLTDPPAAPEPSSLALLVLVLASACTLLGKRLLPN